MKKVICALITNHCICKIIYNPVNVTDETYRELLIYWRNHCEHAVCFNFLNFKELVVTLQLERFEKPYFSRQWYSFESLHLLFIRMFVLFLVGLFLMLNFVLLNFRRSCEALYGQLAKVYCLFNFLFFNYYFQFWQRQEVPLQSLNLDCFNWNEPGAAQQWERMNGSYWLCFTVVKQTLSSFSPTDLSSLLFFSA